MLVQAEPGIEQEISEYFTFFIPGYRFMPSYRNKMWDGKIRLFNLRSKELYIGLLDHLLKFSKERQYEIEYKSFPKSLNKYNKEVEAKRRESGIKKYKDLTITPSLLFLFKKIRKRTTQSKLEIDIAKPQSAAPETSSIATTFA